MHPHICRQLWWWLFRPILRRSSLLAPWGHPLPPRRVPSYHRSPWGASSLHLITLHSSVLAITALNHNSLMKNVLLSQIIIVCLLYTAPKRKSAWVNGNTCKSERHSYPAFISSPKQRSMAREWDGNNNKRSSLSHCLRSWRSTLSSRKHVENNIW